MFIPTWLIIAVIVLMAFRLFIVYRTRENIILRIKKHIRSVESFDVVFTIGKSKIHMYIKDNRDFVIETIE